MAVSPDAPVGGSTGISHEHSEAIAQAARWLAVQPRPLPRAAVPLLRSRFGLSASDACAAIGEAHALMARAP